MVQPSSLPRRPSSYEIVRALQCGQTVVREVHYRAGSTMPWHRHVEGALVYTLAGAYHDVSPGLASNCGPESCRLRPPWANHATRIGRQGALCLSVEIPAAWVERFAPYTPDLFRQPAQASSHRLTAAFTALRSELARPDAVSPLAIEGLACDIVAELTRRTALRITAPPRWLQTAREALLGRLFERPDLRELAGRVGVHPGHLAAQFRRYYGQPMGQFVREQRVRAAAEWLVRTDTSLVELALATGFASQSHFTTAFRKVTGETPGRYRACRRVRPGATGESP